MDAAYSSIADATVVTLGMLHVLASPNDSHVYLRNHTYDFYLHIYRQLYCRNDIPVTLISLLPNHILVLPYIQSYLPLLRSPSGRKP